MLKHIMRNRGRLAAVMGLGCVFAIVVPTAVQAGGDRSAGDPSLPQLLNCTVKTTPGQLLQYHVPKAKKHYDITFMDVSLAGYYYQANVWAAKQAAKEAGVTLHVIAGQGYTNPAQQLQQAQDALQSGTQALVFAPVDVHGSVPVVQKATAAHVPVINYGTPVASPNTFQIIQDDYQMGKNGADQIAKLVPNGGPGIVIAGPANAAWSLKRTAGFQAELKKYPNLSVVGAPTQDVNPAEGLKSFENVVQAHPDIKWIYSVYYYNLLPSSLPSQYQSLPYVTTGYEPGVIKDLQSGGVAATIPVLQVWMGYLGVGEAVTVLNGGTVPKLRCMPAPEFTKVQIGTPFANTELFPNKHF
jgi:ribose transport system substrate-binding protein